MKIKHSGLWALLLSLPSLLGATSTIYTPSFRADKAEFAPLLEEDGYERDIRLYFIRDCVFKVYATFESSLTSGKSFQADDSDFIYTSGYPLITGRDYSGSYKSGQSITLRFFLPRGYCAERDNEVYITYRDGNYGGLGKTQNLASFFSFGKLHPHTWNPLKEPSPLSRNYLTANTYRFPESSGVQPYLLKHTGFAAEYESDDTNTVPLRKMGLAGFNHEGEQILPLNCAWSYLRLKNHLNDYAIGMPGYDQTSTWKDFAVTFVQENGYARIRLAEKFVVSIDGRYMKNYAERGANDVVTTSLYLPPLKAGESKIYEFTLHLEGLGECGYDSLECDFSVHKDHNPFGSSYTSDFALEVS